MWREVEYSTGYGWQASPQIAGVVSWATAKWVVVLSCCRDKLTSAQSRLQKAAGKTGSAPGTVVSLRRTIRPLEQSSAATLVFKGELELPGMTNFASGFVSIV